MTESCDYPVARPILTASLIDDLVEANLREGPRPKAHNTRLRFSDAGACGRRLSLDVAGVEPSNPFDLGSTWVMFLGHVIHQAVQESLAMRYPGAVMEATSRLDNLDSSGSADCLLAEHTISQTVIDWRGGRTLFELKTVNGTAFSSAVGVNRKGYSRGAPKGPRITAKLQGALNAKAHNCETLIVGYIAMESISIGLAERVGLSDIDRFVAEWHYPRQIWEPWADDEIVRQQTILDTVDAGMLAERIVVDDDGRLLPLDPDSTRPPWQCTYCSFVDVCRAAGPGTPPVDVVALPAAS